MRIGIHAQSTFQPTAPYYGTFFYFWSENPYPNLRWAVYYDSTWGRFKQKTFPMIGNQTGIADYYGTHRA